MFAVVILAVIAGFVWMFSAPHMGFAPGFASLLDRPVGSHGLGRFLLGKESVGGEYRGRPVLLVLHHKRGRHSVGYLVVAMKTNDTFRLEKGAGSLREHVTDSDARKAWDTLELDEALKLSFDDGWMKATWQPSGFVMFPGTFDPAKWKRILDAMYRIVQSIN